MNWLPVHFHNQVLSSYYLLSIDLHSGEQNTKVRKHRPPFIENIWSPLRQFLVCWSFLMTSDSYMGFGYTITVLKVFFCEYTFAEHNVYTPSYYMYIIHLNSLPSSPASFLHFLIPSHLRNIRLPATCYLPFILSFTYILGISYKRNQLFLVVCRFRNTTIKWWGGSFLMETKCLFGNPELLLKKPK